LPAYIPGMDENKVLLDLIAFMESPKAMRNLNASAEEIKSVLGRFLRAVYLQLGKCPKDLDGEDLRILLTHLLPQHYSKGDPLGRCTIPILENYLDFLEEEHVVASLFELRNALAQNGEGFEGRIRTGAGTGMGDPIGKQAKPIRHRGEKVGRNDPCPCGSGKKFKKCCMRLGEK